VILDRLFMIKYLFTGVLPNAMHFRNRRNSYSGIFFVYLWN